MTEAPLSLEDFEPRARKTDPQTSREAAASVDKRRVSDTHKLILRIFASAGELCDLDLEVVYQGRRAAAPGLYPEISDSGLRTRRSELVNGGLLADSGRKTTLPTGRKAILWKITDEGRMKV